MRIIAATPAILLMAAASVGQVRPADPVAGRTVSIAVVRDGPMPEDDSISVERELRQVASSGVEIEFLRSSDFDGRFDAASAELALRTALEAPGVDYVLAVGALVSRAARGLPLTKPVVTTYVQRPDYGGFHQQTENHSRTENLAFLQVPLLLEADFTTMGTLLPLGSTVQLLLPVAYRESSVFDPEITALEQRTGYRIEVVPIGDDVAAAVASLPAESIAAFVDRTPQWTASDRQELFEALTARGVATYGLAGHTDVEAGALAGRSPNIVQLRARRVALNLNELFRGSSTDTLPVLLDVDPELLINGSTAMALSYVPSYETLVTARFLHQDALRRDEELLTLQDALAQAAEGNALLQVSEQAVETSFHTWKRAQSPLLPQVYAGMDLFGRNVRGLQGFIPDKVLNGGFSVRQMIYDDRSVTDYKSEGRVYQGSQQALEIDRMDVSAQAASAFLNLALAEILFRVDADNLQLTRDNLELAKVRVDAGYSGEDEVYRWESELNSRQSVVIGSRADIEIERIALNQILGLDQFLRWRPEEITVDPGVFPFLDGGLARYLSDPQKLERFREFSVQFALRSAPELLALQKSAEAQSLQLDQRKRRWYLPVFDTGFQWNYDIWRTPDLPEFERTNWTWDLQAIYPIFEGGFRADDENVNTSELRRLEKEIINTRQAVERRVRTSLRAMEGSFPSIAYLNEAADAARRNFEIVRDRYTEGLVNVTDLLDAQNDRFNTERTAQAAQYAFLLDLVAFQRAISWFEDLKTPEEREALLAEARAFIENPTPPPEEEPVAGAFPMRGDAAPFHLERTSMGAQSLFPGRKP